jgi:hypothetical protein
MSSVTSTHIQSGSLTNDDFTSYLREHRSNRCYLLPRNIHLRNSRNDDFT